MAKSKSNNGKFTGAFRVFVGDDLVAEVKTFAEGKVQYDSWVLRDTGRTVRFYGDDGKLKDKHEPKAVSITDWIASLSKTRNWMFPQSRIVVQLGNFDLMDFVTDGNIPKPLVALVEGIIDSKQRGNASVEIEDLKKLKLLIKLIAKKAIVSPSVVDVHTPDNTDAIPLNFLTMTDLLALFEEVGGTTAAQTFPE